MIPGVQTRVRQSGVPYLMRTGSAGFRCPEFDTARPAGTRRVLVYGDSFTEGVGVSDGSRFTDILESSLPDSQVLNFGVRATGTDQQLLLFRERPAGLEYDLVVVGLYTGDVLRNHSKYGVLTSATGEHFQKPFFRLVGDELMLENVPVPRVPVGYGDLDRTERELVYNRGISYRLRTAVQRYAPWAKTALQHATRYQPAPYLKSERNPAWVLTRAILRQWALEASAPVLVVAIPPYQYVEGTASASAYRRRFAELAADRHLVVLDVLDDLKSAARRHGAESIRLKGDAHYSALGHKAIADSLSPVVEALLAGMPESRQGALA